MSNEKTTETGPQPPANPLAGIRTPTTAPTWPQYLLAGVLSLAVSGGTWFAGSEARDQRISDLERRVEVVESRVSSVDELRTQVATMAATLQSVDRRLQRIEDALDRARPVP